MHGLLLNKMPYKMRPLPRASVGICLALFMLARPSGWAQSHRTDDSLSRWQAHQDSITKPNPPQSVGIESILGPGWAGREKVKPASTKTQPAPTMTPRQYAQSVALALGASLIPVALGTYLLKEEMSLGWGFGLFAAGALVGPSTGQFVYGFTTHGVLATILRAASATAAISIFFGSYGSCSSSFWNGEDEPCSEGFDPTLGLIASGTVFFGSFMYSLVQPAFSIHREPARTYLPVEVLPRLSYDAQGRSITGMTANWRF